jgi:hypothetical protein
MSRLSPKSWGRTLALEMKSLVRRPLGIPDPWKDFRRFEGRIHPETWSRQPEILDWPACCPPPSGPAPERLSRALELRAEVLAKFRDLWSREAHRWRVLIHLPELGVSPAGHSLFRGLGAGLAWIGVPVEYWKAGTPLGAHLWDFRPTMLLSIDHVWFELNSRGSGPDAAAACAYRRRHRLVLGLASNYGLAVPEDPARYFVVARALGVDFFYAFQCPEFVAAKYGPFTEHGFPVASVEFGANPVAYHPLPGVSRDLNYVLLASSNAEKWPRYFEYLAQPLARHPGLIIGPGWTRASTASIPDDQANRLYARARIGLNLHIPFQIRESTELNERAYNLAAAGTPQLMDRPALLPFRLSERAIYSAENPQQYWELFEYILSHPDEAGERGLRSLEEVLNGHTVFHRADALLRFTASHCGHA